MSVSHLHTTDASIAVQVLTGMLSARGIYLELPPEHRILTEMLTLETLVQFVELVFYVSVLREKNVEHMAASRYGDWVITTPTMLVTSIMYFAYEEQQERPTKNLEFWSFVRDNKVNIAAIVTCNFLMLAVGYLGETGALDLATSSALGFAFFAATFWIMYSKYAVRSARGKTMFSFILGVWSLYGVAALLPPVAKNNAFNGLDLVAKNFFGMYLYVRASDLANV